MSSSDYNLRSKSNQRSDDIEEQNSATEDENDVQESKNLEITIVEVHHSGEITQLEDILRSLSALTSTVAQLHKKQEEMDNLKQSQGQAMERDNVSTPPPVLHFNGQVNHAANVKLHDLPLFSGNK